MRLLVVSDIHANQVAFEQVLEDAAGEWDELWCLGDVVGYGPKPNGCVDLVRELASLCLSGNHDWAVLGRLNLDTFNSDARAAVLWTQGQLTEESNAFLEALPGKRELEAPMAVTLAHASPRQPIWEYILDAATAAANFGQLETDLCLVGHTHVPVVYEALEDGRVTAWAPLYGETIPLKGRRLIINPGSVGQPRDSDPRAAYALLDTEEMSWEHRRVGYDINETQLQMHEAGLPMRLIGRLSFGW
jgi:predicted phosphodiesterase